MQFSGPEIVSVPQCTEIALMGACRGRRVSARRSRGPGRLLSNGLPLAVRVGFRAKRQRVGSPPRYGSKLASSTFMRSARRDPALLVMMSGVLAARSASAAAKGSAGFRRTEFLLDL